MASPTLITPTMSTSKPLLTPTIKSKLTNPTTSTTSTNSVATTGSRGILSLAAGIFSPALLLLLAPEWAAENEEYVKETTEVMNKVRTTITLDKNDPNIDAAVADLTETSNSWVAKYRREKALLGRPSFWDIYSALNAVSGHFVSFGPTAPIPAKRKQRILEEVDTAEKALLRGR